MNLDAANRSPSANGAYKGRGRQYANLLVCPADRSGLVRRENALHCTADPAHVYPIVEGIARLVTSERAASLDARSAAYEAARAADGWAVPDEAGFKSLPQTPLPGYPEGYWDRYAAATALLWRFIEVMRLRSGGLPVGPAGEAAVVGAEMGWLAYALDVAGYTTIALDAYAGARFGLGVYPIARYFRVQADPLHPPLAQGAFDLVIFQRGVDGEPRATLGAAVRSLRPGGALAIMDALAERDLDGVAAALRDAGLQVLDPPQRPGLRARLSELGDRIAGRDAERPPVIFAQKPK